MWYRRISMECRKQEDNPDINLSHRIVALSVTSLDSFPKSTLLWEQYLHNTKVSFIPAL